ncbi:MAG: Type 1 glutamine amidotransferase-like domain-containing protein [Christensenellaceae bacterium]|jgi:dipeptidase E|nr:Type 1 glutamine amidotransferase-like domain-containing protein [Christensenellaceae bacterium]
MILYLSSHKLGRRTEELKSFIKEIGGNKILFIANARDGKTDKEKTAQVIKDDMKELESLGYKVTLLDLKNYFGRTDDLWSCIQNFNGFYVIGGTTLVLRRAFALSGFDKILLNLWHNQKYLYIGYSAGICVLSENLSLSTIDKNKEINFNPYNDDKNLILSGVGYFHNCWLPHYKSQNIGDVIEKRIKYAKENNIPYETIQDGEVKIFYSHAWQKR